MVLRIDSRMEVMELVTDGILADGVGEVVFDEVYRSYRSVDSEVCFVQCGGKRELFVVCGGIRERRYGILMLGRLEF